MTVVPLYIMAKYDLLVGTKEQVYHRTKQKIQQRCVIPNQVSLDDDDRSVVVITDKKKTKNKKRTKTPTQSIKSVLSSSSLSSSSIGTNDYDIETVHRLNRSKRGTSRTIFRAMKRNV